MESQVSKQMMKTTNQLADIGSVILAGKQPRSSSRPCSECPQLGTRRPPEFARLGVGGWRGQRHMRRRFHETSPAMDSDAIFYQFSRSKIERCDFSHFLGLYAPEKLPGGRRLRAMTNT